jgi:RNA polymerase sigma-70 factor (ECF subfamily)
MGRGDRGRTGPERMRDAQSGKSRREEVERLYREYGAGLLAYGCAITVDRAAAEDVLQQLFLKLLREDVELPEMARPYLYRAMRNAALNSRRRVVREIELDAESSWFVAPPAQMEEALTLQVELQVLPEEQREAVVLHIWGQLTLQEVADVTGVALNTAASRYRYGLGKLRERMRPAGME